MKKILLIFAVILFVTKVFAQAPVPITGPSKVCVGSSVTFNDLIPSGTWASGNPLIATVGSATGIVTGVTAGITSITYAIGTSYVTAGITVNAVPAAIFGPATICTGGMGLFTDGTALGVWSSTSPLLASIGTSGTATGIAAGGDTIVYTLTLTGCKAKMPVTVNSTAVSGVTSLCLGGSPTILSDVTAGGTWTSSNPGIASIGASSGILSGVSAGSVTITYTVNPACKGFATAYVRALPVITPLSASGCVGSNYPFTALPGGGGWTSSNPTVASINFVGVVTGLATGTSTISYTAPGGCQSSATITVNPLPLPISGVNYVYSGLTTSLLDITGGGIWSSSDASLATVSSSGLVTGVSAGLVLISYTLPGTGCASTYRVDVNPLPGTSNLYAWYPFCGDTDDHSGFNRDLLNFVGTPAVLANDRFGNANNAYSFSGGNCIMEYSTFFPNPGLPPDFTYSCWIDASVPQSSFIFYNGNPNTDGYGLVVNDGTAFPGGTGTKVSLYFGGVGQYLSVDLSAAGSPALGNWHNIVIVKNGNSYHLYLDDVSEGFVVASFNPPSTGSVFSIGGNGSGAPLPGSGFIGSIDDLAYITRQLSTSERLSMYNFNPDAKKFTLGNDTTICSDNIKLAPNPQTLGGAYIWQTYVTGSGYVTTDSTDTAYMVYPTGGILGNSYLLSISKPYGCTSADTITVYKNPIPVHLGPDKNFCLGDTVKLSSYFPTSSFLWSTGDTTHAINITQTGTYFLTVDSVIHLGVGDSAVCVGRDTINLHASTVPIITIPSSVINCAGNPAQVFTHSDPGYTYFWSNGYVGDSTFIATSGTFWVRVTDSGCARSDTLTAVIIDESVTLANGDTAICFGEKITGVASVNPAVSYQWTPTAGMAVSNQPSVPIVPDTSAEYYLIVSFPGCPNIVDSFHLDVQPRPSVSIGGNRDVCEGDTIHVFAKTNYPWYKHFNYIWTPANAQLDTTDTSTVVFYASSSHDSEELIVKVYPPVFLTNIPDSLCYGEDSAAIFVHPKFYDSLAARYDFCPGDSLQLVPMPNQFTVDAVPDLIVAATKWSPGTYLNDSTAANPWIHPITSLGYRGILYSQFGCADTIYTTVVVHPAAVIDLGDSVVLSPGQSYHIQPQTNCDIFSWFPPLGLDDTSASDPTATPLSNTTYIVHAATEDGCMVVDSIRIHVDPGTLVAIPNAFTPGASVNGTFNIINHGLVTLSYFRIFDRWGNKVFETTNINQGWDGNFNGSPQPFGVYVYDLEAITSTGITFHREGNVTLIR